MSLVSYRFKIIADYAEHIEGGSNADNVLADAFQKINGSDIDWATAYEAVVKDATVEPYGVLDKSGNSCFICLRIFRLVLRRPWWP